MHVPKLRAENISRRSILLHIDINSTLKHLCVKRPDSLDFPEDIKSGHPREDIDLTDSHENDLLLSYFLEDPFFLKFSSIHIATVLCGPNENFRRNKKKSDKINSEPPLIYCEIYHEVYRCWNKCIQILNPKTARNIDTSAPYTVITDN